MNDAESRFWSHVDKSSECWEWSAAKTNGYGQFKIDGKQVAAHRYAWELTNGPIPDGNFHGTMCICHHCDNRACVNPSHLFLSDHAGNMADRTSKERSANGSQHGRAKLYENDIPRIRDMLRSGATHKSIAGLFGVSISAIQYIKNGKNWGHVAG